MLLNSRIIFVAPLVGVLLASGVTAALAQALAAPARADQTATVAQNADSSPPKGTLVDDDGARKAARSRMRECGHQWSAMKKSGAAAGMTWKEFSQGCLAKT